MPRPPRRTRRSGAQTRFSAFFHGRSVIVPSDHARKAVPTAPVRTPIFDSYSTSTLRSRSPTSTRSLIDPSSSPLTCTESLPRDSFPGFEGAPGRSNMAYIPPARLPIEDQHPARSAESSPRRAWRRPKKAANEKRYLCFSGIRNPKIRRKVIGSLISGCALAIVLTICTPTHPSPHLLPPFH